MPRPTQLAAVPTEALVNELKSRFAAIEKAKELLFETDRAYSTRRRSSERAHVPSTGRKSGGTSPYAQNVSRIIQTMRHARNRIKRGTARPGDAQLLQRLEKKLKALRTQHNR